jgi:Spy/CpxP family protein refolding chaperone
MTTRGLSITLAAVLAVPMAAVAGTPPPAGQPGAPPHGEFERGPGGPGMRLLEELGLSDEQKGQVQALHARQRETLRPLLESAHQAREAFHTALEADNADATTVGQAALAMKAADARLRAAHDAAREEMKALLTPDQRERLEKLEASRPEHGGPRGFGRPGPRP